MRYSRSTHYKFSTSERAEINRISAQTGCHSCGVSYPKTRSRQWICDPQPPSGVNWAQRPQRFYPHCLLCKKKQGCSIRELVLKNGLPPLQGVDVPGCVLFVSDTQNEVPPPEMHGAANVWSNADCIAVGCVSYMDEAPNVELIASNEAIDPGTLAFDGWINTPNRCLAMLTQDNEVLLMKRVNEIRTRVRVWTNHGSEPDRIVVGFYA